MNNVERKAMGLPYCYDDPALLGDQHIYQNKMCEYNQTLPTEVEKRQQLLREVFAKIVFFNENFGGMKKNNDLHVQERDKRDKERGRK